MHGNVKEFTYIGSSFYGLQNKKQIIKLIGVNIKVGVVQTIFLEQSLMSSGKINGSHYLESK